LLHLLALEDVLAQEFLARWLQHVLELVEEEVQELLRVALDGCVGRVTLIILVSEAKLCRVDVAAVGHFKLRKELLQLMKQVVVQHVLAVSVSHLLHIRWLAIVCS
jgi:hypothetical protein